MTHKRLSLFTVLILLILLVSQLIPTGKSASAAAPRCNSAGFIADVTVPDGSSSNLARPS